VELGGSNQPGGLANMEQKGMRRGPNKGASCHSPILMAVMPSIRLGPRRAENYEKDGLGRKKIVSLLI